MLDDDNMEQEDYSDDETPDTPVRPQTSKEEKQKNTISADLIRGHINTIILRTLSERDKYGYEIIEEIEKKSHGQYELKQPTLYSALKRLENQGYIKAYWKTDEISAGGRRKYFTLTESGKEITEKNRAEWEYSRTVIDNLISDKEYDFSQPAPTPVDFKILKQSTSRVPTVKLEETNANKAETDNDNQNVVSYSYSEAINDSISLDASAQYNVDPSPVVEEIKQETVEEPQPPEQHEESVPTTATESTPIQPIYSRNDEVSIPKQESVDQFQTSGHSEGSEQFYSSEIHEQHASYFRTESIEEAYGDQYNQYAQPEVQQPAQANYEPNNPSIDSEQYKKLHENYLKLLDDSYIGNGKHKSKQPEYGENLDTDKLIYINKPETERDYKNLVNDIYSQTIKPQNTKPMYEPDPELYEQPAPPPVMEQAPVNNSLYVVKSEESRQAESDGLKIFTYDRQPKPNGKYSKSYNLGEALFKSATITFIYLIIIFAVTLICKSTLDVSLVYPFVIFAIACCLFAVCAILALCGFGRNTVKSVTHGYIGVCAILTVIAILIVCVIAILLNIDFSSITDVCRKMIIPSLTLLAIPLYSVMFYIFSK